MTNIQQLELFPKEIYSIEQFMSYEYYYATVKLWEDLIQYAENLLDKYSANLPPHHRAKHSSDQADYVWGTIVLPNFKSTLHHLLNGLDELKNDLPPLLRRMSSINNDIIAQGRDYPYDWMNEVEQAATDIYKNKESIVFTRANNIYITSDYYDSQWDFEDLLNEEYLVGVNFPNPLPKYKLNTDIIVKTDEPVLVTGIYRSNEQYSACKFLIKENKISSNELKVAPKVKCYKANPNNFTKSVEIEDSRRVETTWILVERVNDENAIESRSNYIKLTKKGGEKVSQNGYWTTPAQPNVRSYFKQGEIFPNFESDWGDIYWQFDGEE